MFFILYNKLIILQNNIGTYKHIIINLMCLQNKLLINTDTNYLFIFTHQSVDIGSWLPIYRLVGLLIRAYDVSAPFRGVIVFHKNIINK